MGGELRRTAELGWIKGDVCTRGAPSQCNGCSLMKWHVSLGGAACAEAPRTGRRCLPGHRGADVRRQDSGRRVEAHDAGSDSECRVVARPRLEGLRCEGAATQVGASEHTHAHTPHACIRTAVQRSTQSKRPPHRALAGVGSKVQTLSGNCGVNVASVAVAACGEQQWGQRGTKTSKKCDKSDGAHRPAPTGQPQLAHAHW